MTLVVRLVLLLRRHTKATALVAVVAVIAVLLLISDLGSVVVNNIATILAALVVLVAVPLTWSVAFRLIRLSRSGIMRQNRALRERAVVECALAVLVTVFAVVFINNELGVPPLTVPETKILTRGSLLLLSVIPSLYWLWLYRKK